MQHNPPRSLTNTKRPSPPYSSQGHTANTKRPCQGQGRNLAVTALFVPTSAGHVPQAHDLSTYPMAPREENPEASWAGRSLLYPPLSPTSSPNLLPPKLTVSSLFAAGGAGGALALATRARQDVWA